MSELVEDLKNETALQMMLKVTDHIRDKAPLIDIVIISETINGRSYQKYRSGLIYLAHDLGNVSVAKEFVRLSLHFAIYVEQKNRHYDRCQQATKLCNNIKFELKL